MKTWNDMITEAKAEISLLQPEGVKTKLSQGKKICLIDCREGDEFQAGHIPGALTIARGVIEMTMERNFSDRNQEIIIYCAGGGRSALAAQALKQMGYEDVASMEEGFGGWKKRSFPVETP